MNETGLQQRRKYHVGTLQTDQELIDQFVVRQSELGIVLDTLKENIDADSCQHTLVVAPRGRGKTTLLVRVIAEIRRSPDLSKKLLPIRFMEESLEIFTIADFWLECLFYIAKEIQGNDPEFAKELTDTHSDLTGQWDQGDIENKARSAVLDAADRLNPQLVVIIENLQTLSDETDDDFGWGLRKILQSEKQIMLLASATSQFDGLDDPKAPYFEIFKQVCLRPLDEHECLTLWEKVSGQKSTVKQIKPLKILTGGSPRLMVVIAEFGRNHSLKQLMEQLVNLIDDHTEYFRNHLEAIPTHERRVYISLIDLWQPSTAKEIADRARMDIRKTSSLLTRLVKRGVILSEGSSKKKLYCVSERLYSIYYKLRRERDEATIVRNLIHFMSVFYSREEMGVLSSTIINEAKQSLPIRLGVTQAVQEHPEIREIFADNLKHLDIKLEQINKPDQKFGAIQKAYSEKNFTQVIRLADSYIDSLNKTTLPTKAHALKCSALYEVGKIQELIASSEVFLDLSPENQGQVYQLDVASVLYFRGLGLMTLHQYPKAIISFEQAIERVSDSQHEKLMDIAAKSLFMCGRSYFLIDNIASASKYYQEVVTRYKNSQQVELQLDVAMTLITQADAFNTLGDQNAALKCLEVLINQYADTHHAPLQIWVVESLFVRSAMYSAMDDNNKAIDSYSEMIDQYIDNANPQIQVKVAKAIFNRGQCYFDNQEMEAAVENYDQLIERFRGSDNKEIQRVFVSALNNRGNILGELNKPYAITSYNEAIDQFGHYQESEFREEIAKAWLNRSLCLTDVGAWTVAIENNDEFINRYADDENLVVQIALARALINRGENYDKLSQSHIAIKDYDEVIKRHSNTMHEILQVEVATAYSHLVASYKHLGKYTEGVERRDILINTYANSENIDIQNLVGQALIYKAYEHCSKVQLDDALRIHQRIKHNFVSRNDKAAIKILWLADWIKLFVDLIRDQGKRVIDKLESILTKYALNNFTTLNVLIENIQSLIVYGMQPKDVVLSLERQDDLKELIQPLLVALRILSKENIRVPSEIYEVAEDILQTIYQQREAFNKNQAT